MATPESRASLAPPSRGAVLPSYFARQSLAFPLGTSALLGTPQGGGHSWPSLGHRSLPGDHRQSLHLPPPHAEGRRGTAAPRAAPVLPGPGTLVELNDSAAVLWIHPAGFSPRRVQGLGQCPYPSTPLLGSGEAASKGKWSGGHRHHRPRPVVSQCSVIFCFKTDDSCHYINIYLPVLRMSYSLLLSQLRFGTESSTVVLRMWSDDF